MLNTIDKAVQTTSVIVATRPIHIAEPAFVAFTRTELRCVVNETCGDGVDILLRLREETNAMITQIQDDIG